jgi:hypothetical protein
MNIKLRRSLYLLGYLAVLVACGAPDDTPLTPFQCRVTGVNVQDTDQVTGQVNKVTYYDTKEEVRAACMRPFSVNLYGCSIPIGEAEYNIVVLSFSEFGLRFKDTPSYNTILNHEYCHAYYEERRHME